MANRLISVPISEMMTCALSSLTSGMVISWLTASRKLLIDLVIYFACVSAGQSPPVIRSLGPAFLLHLCECLLGLVSTMRRSSRQVIVTHVARLFLHHSNPANGRSGASVNEFAH